MSSSIWTQCGGNSNRRRIEAKPWRIVEAQHSSSTWKLVDSQAEHDVLEELIEGSKPRLLPAREFEGLHWLLFTPFRYPPREHGSRFGRRDARALWYGSDELHTALAEDAYYRLSFFAGTAAKLAPHRVPRSAFQAHVRTNAGIDLTAARFGAYEAQLRSPFDYSATQALGSEMREAGIEAFRFASARDPRRGTNVALFSPKAFAAKAPLGASQTWNCTVTTSGDVAFDHETIGGVDRVFFSRADFLVNGQLPAPAT